MKLLHISDLHIGIKLYQQDLKEDQEYVFEQIVEQVRVHKPDALLIAGDIFDKSTPSTESIQFFDSFLNALYEISGKMHIMIVSGNHDSATKLNQFRRILKGQNVHMIGLSPRIPQEYIEKVVLEDSYGKVNFYLLPFVKPSMIRAVVNSEEEESLSYDEALHRLFARETINDEERNVLVSHQFYYPVGKKAEDVERMESENPVGNVDAVSADVLEPFDYAALGHIHKPMTVGENRFRYSGTPLAYSVDEAGQEKGSLLIELEEPGTPAKITKLPLTPLRLVRKLTGSFADIMKQPSNDYVYIALTDEEDLAVIGVMDRIKLAFPHYLEVRRTGSSALNQNVDLTGKTDMDPYDLICEFLDDLGEEEKNILKEVVQQAKEENV